MTNVLAPEIAPANRQKGIVHTGVAVVFVCHDGQGRFVLDRRSINARDEQGRWEFGGGALEFGASVEDTLRREVREEYGTEVLTMEFLGFRDVHRRPAGIRTHWIVLDFKVLVDPTQVHNAEPDKFDEIGWFTLDTLPPVAQLHSQFPQFLETYRSKLV